GRGSDSGEKLAPSDVEKIFELARFDKKKKNLLLKALKKTNADGADKKDEDLFLEFFRANHRAETDKEIRLRTEGKEKVQMLWSFFEKILAPRLFKVFENAAVYNPTA